MPSLRNPRGTRAALDALATANGIKSGQIYLITDESRIAIGTAVNAYETYAKESEAGGGGSATVEQITVDFGVTGVYSKSGTATVTGAINGDKFIMTAAPSAIADEGEMDGFLCSARGSALDTLTYAILTVPGPVRGTKTFNLIKG